MIRIVLTDDHQMFRDGVKMLLDSNEDFEVIAEAENGEALLEHLKTKETDLVLLDINMPKMGGEETAERIKKEYPEVKILVLTMHDTADYIAKMLKLGADGYLLKTTSKDELFEGIKNVMAGENFYGKEVQQTFMSSFSSNNVSSEIHLTTREKDILQLICEECNTNEIADKLFISPYTVETHRKNLLSKTGSKNVAGLVKFAIENKIVS